MKPKPSLSFFPVTGLPLIEPGCDLAALIIEHLGRNGLKPQDGDVVATYADIDALMDAVGFKPATPLKEGIEMIKKAGLSAYEEMEPAIEKAVEAATGGI